MVGVPTWLSEDNDDGPSLGELKDIHAGLGTGPDRMDVPQKKASAYAATMEADIKTQAASGQKAHADDMRLGKTRKACRAIYAEMHALEVIPKKKEATTRHINRSTNIASAWRG